MLKKILVFSGGMDFPTAYIMISTLCLAVLFVIISACIKSSHKRIYEIIATIPLLNFAVFYMLNYTAGNQLFGLMRYHAQLIISLIICVASIMISKSKRRTGAFIMLSVFTCLLSAWSLLYVLGVEGTIRLDNSTHMNYVDSMESTIDELEHYYILRGHKEIDFDALRDKYIPLALEAQENNDEVAFAQAVTELAYEFHDGHLYCMVNDDDLSTLLTEKLSGNDYGFSMARLDDGSVIVILLDEESQAQSLGLYNGAVITKWDGISIDTAVSSVECVPPSVSFYDYPTLENEERARAMYLAGRGGDEVSVSFIDENGVEQTIKVRSIGSYSSRLMTATKPLTTRYQEEFAYSTMLNDNTGYLYIPRERYSTYSDIYAALADDYPKIKDLVISKIDVLQNQGMEKLIIDIRGNGGGYDAIYEQIVSMLTVDDIVRYGGTYSYEEGFAINYDVEYRIEADGRYVDIPVVVLVNAGCVSSGDLLAYNLSLCPNVTMMGMTTTCGSAQTIGGVCMLSGGKIEIHYPMYPILNPDGSICVDAGPERKNPLDIDERIPFDMTAVEEIYYSDNDYELEYVLDYTH